MTGQMIDIEAKEGGKFTSYLAKSTSENGPGIVMIQEIFGVTDWMKQTADRFAENGYTVIAPDMFWRFAPNFVAKPGDEEDFQKAFSYLQQVNHDTAVDDIEVCADHLKGMSECNGKIGVTGFCLGGTFTYLSAARLDIDGAVAYYGTQIHEYLDEGKQVTCPTILHMGEHDETFTVEDRGKIHAALIGKPNVAIYMYDAGHAFANSDRQDVYNAEAAELAHQRSFELFAQLK